jgi:hypothetical protein
MLDNKTSYDKFIGMNNKFKITKANAGFYKTEINGREFWIQSPEYTETPQWLLFEATQGFGITTEESCYFDTKKEAIEHLNAIFN